MTAANVPEEEGAQTIADPIKRQGWRIASLREALAPSEPTKSAGFSEPPRVAKSCDSALPSSTRSPISHHARVRQPGTLAFQRTSSTSVAQRRSRIWKGSSDCVLRTVRHHAGFNPFVALERQPTAGHRRPTAPARPRAAEQQRWETRPCGPMGPQRHFGWRDCLSRRLQSAECGHRQKWARPHGIGAAGPVILASTQ